MVLSDYVSILFVLIAIVIAWIPRLPTALFVDEAATYWMIKDGWLHSLYRSLQIPGQSSFYAILLSGWSSVWGTGELTLRMPSILAGAGVCVSLGVFSRLRRSPSLTFASGLVVLSPTFTFASTSARPYGLGLFLGVTSLVIAQFASERDSRALMHTSGAIAALSLYCHITFLAVMPALLVVALQSSRGIRAKKIAYRMALTATLCAVPVLLHHYMLDQSRISEVAVLDEMPTAITLIWYISSVPIVLVCLWLLSVKLCVSRAERMLRPGYAKDLVLGLVLCLSSKFLALLAAMTIDPTLLLPRYCALASVGEAIVAASLLSSIKRPIWRRSLSLACAVCLVLPWFRMSPPDTAWLSIARDTKEYIQAEKCDVFALVGFAESRHVGLLMREPERSFIRSPLDYYQLLPATLLPAQVESAEELEYMRSKVFPEVDRGECHVLLTWEPQIASPESRGPGALVAEMRRRVCVSQVERTSGLVTMSVWRCPLPNKA